MSILEVNDNFTLSKEINGPLLATTVVIELLLALSINLFVLIFTLCHPKSLKQPSIIFLTSFVFVNLVTAILIMPSIAVTAVYEEWIFGETIETKNGTCQFFGFVFVCVCYFTFMTIGIISVDRFLFIVKPLVYKRVMKTWVAIGIVVFLWILSCLLNIPPFFGLGQYIFMSSIGICATKWSGQRPYVLYFCVWSITVTTVILVTTLWTFCFTRRFFKQTRDQTSTSEKGHDEHNKHVYNSRVKKLIGIFSALLIVMVVCFIPSTLYGIIGLIIGSENLPDPVLASVVIFFLINSIANPIVQSYFRKDLNEFIVRMYKKVAKVLSCSREVEEDTSETAN